jgi:hypothetical protein
MEWYVTMRVLCGASELKLFIKPVQRMAKSADVSSRHRNAAMQFPMIASL